MWSPHKPLRLLDDQRAEKFKGLTWGIFLQELGWQGLHWPPKELHWQRVLQQEEEETKSLLDLSWRSLKIHLNVMWLNIKKANFYGNKISQKLNWDVKVKKIPFFSFIRLSVFFLLDLLDLSWRSLKIHLNVMWLNIKKQIFMVIKFHKNKIEMSKSKWSHFFPSSVSKSARNNCIKDGPAEGIQ